VELINVSIRLILMGNIDLAGQLKEADSAGAFCSYGSIGLGFGEFGQS
jgi:hypothetical protein